MKKTILTICLLILLTACKQDETKQNKASTAGKSNPTQEAEKKADPKEKEEKKKEKKKTRKRIKKKDLSTKKSTKVYKNSKYGISINYPSNWFAKDEDDSFTKEKFITFSNLEKKCGKGNCPNDYSAFFVRIYSSKSETHNEFDELKSKYEKLATAKELLTDNKVNFYLISKQSEKPDETWDMIKPVVRAFFQGDKYSFMFYIATEIPSGSSGQEAEVEILREALKTLKISGQSGKVTKEEGKVMNLSGAYYYYLETDNSVAPYKETALKKACFNPAQTETVNSGELFCFNNTKEALDILGIKEIDKACKKYWGTAEIKIKGLTDDVSISKSDPCIKNGNCAFNEAELIEVIKLYEDTPQCGK